jgi:hypothetical protein
VLERDELHEHRLGVTYRMASAGLGGRIEVRRGSPTGADDQHRHRAGHRRLAELDGRLRAADRPGTTDRTCFVFRRNPGDQGLFNLNWIEFVGAGVSHR